MKTVIEMAREAGWKDLRDYDSEMHNDIFMGNTDSLKAFAELVRTDEREACAKLCEDFADQDSGPDGICTDYHAHLIRARGETK